MKDKSKNRKRISRRRILPILGGTLLLPLFGFNQAPTEDVKISKEDEEYEKCAIIKGRMDEVNKILRKGNI